MKTKTKALVLALCAVLLVVTTVFATMAYLTSTDSVQNTFSVGKVAISLDEKDVDGSKTDTTTVGRDKANAYTIVPGQRYSKDPIVHVDATSESSYVFIRVENGISKYEAQEATGEDAYTPIAKQITDNNGWTPLTGVSGVYYKEYTKGQADKDLEVFNSFKIADKANDVDGWDAIDGNTTIEVFAYAIQKAGFENDVVEAWATVSDSENG